MKMKKTLFLCALLISALSWAKKPTVAISYNVYQTSAGQSYIETYFSLDPLSVSLKPNKNGLLQGGIEILLIFEQNGKIVAYDKLALLSTEMKDTVSEYPFSLQQSRIMLDTGNYIMKIEVADMQTPESPISMAADISIQRNTKDISISNIQLLDSYTPAATGSTTAKWGFDMVPLVPLGTYYIPEQLQTLPFFVEVANTDSVLGKSQPFIIKYYLQDNTRNITLNKYAGFQKATSGAVIPVLNTFNINKLPSGYYNLKVDVVGKENITLATQDVPFYRSNPSADNQELDLNSVQLGNSFVLGFHNLDTMLFYIDCLYPRSSEAERRIAQNVSSSANIELMQRFFLMFWNTRDPVNPELAWQNYLEVVNYAQKSFGTRSIPGYRTDMGRVLLQYGQPSTIERSFNEPSNYPWQIWQYDVLESPSTPKQNNRMFVFVDQAMAGRTFVLIHSTGIGEVQDYKWQYALNRNTNRGQDVDATSSPEARDDFGYRVNNNFIIGDHRYWGDR
jgi:GWxTD domain-containing protein